MEEKFEEKDFEIQDSNATKKLKGLGLDMNEKIHSEEDEIKKGNLVGAKRIKSALAKQKNIGG